MSEKLNEGFNELLNSIYQMKNTITILQNQVKLVERIKTDK